MNMQKQFAQQYANTQVETSVSEATPHKLVEVLYDGVLKNLVLAKTFMQQKAYDKKAEHVNKVLAILANLRDGVDVEKGGDIAENFWAIYDYCYRTVLKASSHNNIEQMDEIFNMLKDISSAWKEMPENIKRATEDQIKRLSA